MSTEKHNIQVFFEKTEGKLTHYGCHKFFTVDSYLKESGSGDDNSAIKKVIFFGHTLELPFINVFQFKKWLQEGNYLKWQEAVLSKRPIIDTQYTQLSFL